jgi:TRAP-type transport system periplasmic protein
VPAGSARPRDPQRWAPMNARSLVTTLVTALAVLVTAFAPDAQAGTHLRIGTLAPTGSPWAKDLTEWAHEIEQATGGDLTIDVRCSYGDDLRMVGDMRSGALDGVAMMSAAGLGQIDRRAAALDLPGLFPSRDRAIAVRDQVRDELADGFSKQGFVLIGLYDVGTVYLMTVGATVNEPADLRGLGLPFLAGDPNMPTLFELIGDIFLTQVTMPEILPGLNNGSIDALFAPALLAEQLQWASKIDTLMTHPVAYSIGGLVITSRAMFALPDVQRRLVMESGANETHVMAKHAIIANDKTYARLVTRKTPINLTAAEKAKWAAVFKKTISRTRSAVFDASWIDRLQALAN